MCIRGCCCMKYFGSYCQLICDYVVLIWGYGSPVLTNAVPTTIGMSIDLASPSECHSIQLPFSLSHSFPLSFLLPCSASSAVTSQFSVPSSIRCSFLGDQSFDQSTQSAGFRVGTMSSPPKRGSSPHSRKSSRSKPPPTGQQSSSGAPHSRNPSTSKPPLPGQQSSSGTPHSRKLSCAKPPMPQEVSHLSPSGCFNTNNSARF